VEIDTIESNNVVFKTKITVNKRNLVFPVQTSLVTLVLPLIVSLLIYIIFIIIPDESFVSIIKSLYTLELSIILGTAFVLIVSLYWYYYWKKNFSSDNIINMSIDKTKQILEISRDVGSNQSIDAYEIPLEFLINIIIGRSSEGQADGWSINLFIRNRNPKKNPETYSIFVLNDQGLIGLYKIAQELQVLLNTLDLQNILRISDLFLRKVKEKDENI
jgi:hypothetical protein